MNVVGVIRRAFEEGRVDTLTYMKALIQYNDIIEKAGHKYIRKILSSSGKWRYIYEELKGRGFKEEDLVKHALTASHKLIRRLEKDIVNKTEQKYESCYVVKDGRTIYGKDGEKSQIALDDLNVSLDDVKGSIFTHNHPTSKCFSLPDLLTTIYHGFGEMRAIAPNSVVGPVVFVFKNKGMSPELYQHFEREYKKIDSEVSGEFWKKIHAASNSDHDSVIDHCERMHHVEVLLRLKQKFNKLEKSLGNPVHLNKWEFYWEKYE